MLNNFRVSWVRVGGLAILFLLGGLAGTLGGGGIAQYQKEKEEILRQKSVVDPQNVRWPTEEERRMMDCDVSFAGLHARHREDGEEVDIYFDERKIGATADGVFVGTATIGSVIRCRADDGKYFAESKLLLCGHQSAAEVSIKIQIGQCECRKKTVRVPLQEVDLGKRYEGEYFDSQCKAVERGTRRHPAQSNAINARKEDPGSGGVVGKWLHDFCRRQMFR